jgi:hypothetical protein
MNQFDLSDTVFARCVQNASERLDEDWVSAMQGEPDNASQGDLESLVGDERMTSGCARCGWPLDSPRPWERMDVCDKCDAYLQADYDAEKDMSRRAACCLLRIPNDGGWCVMTDGHSGECVGYPSREPTISNTFGPEQARGRRY